MDRSLDDLSARFKPLAEALLKKLTEAGIKYVVIDTLRTGLEQQEAIAKGLSWTSHSKHLTGDALDVAPLVDGKIDWNTKNPIWTQMGEIGESLGLVWGGRWVRTPDYDHFEINEG